MVQTHFVIATYRPNWNGPLVSSFLRSNKEFEVSRVDFIIQDIGIRHRIKALSVNNCGIHFACTAVWPMDYRSGDGSRPIH